MLVAEPSWEPGFDAAERLGAGSLVFAFAAGRLLVPADGAPGPVPASAFPPEALAAGRAVMVGRFGAAAAFAVALEGEPAAEGLAAAGLRELLAVAPAGVGAAAGRAAQIVEWELGHAFCGRCGSPTDPSPSELARTCPRCGAHYYPRISPAAIMLVEDGERVLLARRAGTRLPFYSVLAGFVEPGETLEETVRREVLEEVGIEVDDVRYFGSQPWPFPSQLMIGFTARAAGGELTIDPAELADAGWYRPHELPEVPGPFTIARHLIDDFVARHAV